MIGKQFDPQLIEIDPQFIGWQIPKFGGISPNCPQRPPIKPPIEGLLGVTMDKDTCPLGAEVAESECELHRVVEGCHKVDVDATSLAWDPRGHVDS